MAILRFLLGGLALGFVALLVWAQMTDGRSLPDAFSEMFETPWTITAIADLYLGFFIAAIIIILAERRLWVGLAWALPIFVLGNVVTLTWMAWRLPSLRQRLDAPK